MAALPPEGTGRAASHYNGKLERPAVHRPPPADAILAAWDFTIGIPNQSATDTGPHAAHARLIEACCLRPWPGRPLCPTKSDFSQAFGRARRCPW